MDDIKRRAILSPDGMYRYRLDRSWDEGPTVLFVMLNPSTADGMEDDPTLRRCIGFAQEWGYGSLMVANLYAFRATDPTELKTAADPIGPDCSFYLRQCLSEASLVVAAWESNAEPDRAAEVLAQLGPDPRALGWNKDGQPKHPLYLRRDTLPMPWAP